MTAMSTLAGKVALVTGGSRGLGREMVRAFAGAGATVAIASRKRDACDALAAEVHAEFGRDATGHACHVGRWAEIGALVDEVYERHGHIDVLVNNAGIAPLYPSLSEISEDLFVQALLAA